MKTRGTIIISLTITLISLLIILVGTKLFVHSDQYTTVKGNVYVRSGENGIIKLDLPKGFTYKNCYVVGYKYQENKGDNFYTTSNKGMNNNFETNPFITVDKNNKITIVYNNNYNYEQQFSIEVLLIKY